MKVYTRIEKYKDRSKPIDENPYYVMESPKKRRSGIIAISILIIIAIVTAGVWLSVFKEQNTDSPSTVQKEISQSIVQANPEQIPEFVGVDYVELNGNIPGFSENDYELIRGEYYSELDYLGRCGVVYANIDSSMRPTEERGSIGMIKPSGWNQAKYEGYVDSKPPYLYNRCHLIAYALTGQNANELNLITGTRYFNVTSMLPFEERVMRYLDSSDNHVLYRVTPYFKDEELVARGVEIEAYSIEDNGRGISFHVFVYNYQPGIEINYLTGESWIE